MKTNFLSNLRAFTLAEIMVAMGVMTMMMAGILLIYMSSTKIASAGINQLTVQARARNCMDTVLNDVRRSQQAVIYSTYNGQATFTGNTNSDAGSYIIFNIPTNTLNGVTDQQYHHYYVGNLKVFANNLTNGTLYTFTCNSDTNLNAKSADRELVRGLTNPDRVFDWINGVVNINVRVADENDADGKQIIYLRSAVSFRNGD